MSIDWILLLLYQMMYIVWGKKEASYLQNVWPPPSLSSPFIDPLIFNLHFFKQCLPCCVMDSAVIFLVAWTWMNYLQCKIQNRWGRRDKKDMLCYLFVKLSVWHHCDILTFQTELLSELLRCMWSYFIAYMILWISFLCFIMNWSVKIQTFSPLVDHLIMPACNWVIPRNRRRHLRPSTLCVLSFSETWINPTTLGLNAISQQNVTLFNIWCSL